MQVLPLSKGLQGLCSLGTWRKSPAIQLDTALALVLPSWKSCDPHKSFMNVSFHGTC